MSEGISTHSSCILYQTDWECGFVHYPYVNVHACKMYLLILWMLEWVSERERGGEGERSISITSMQVHAHWRGSPLNNTGHRYTKRSQSMQTIIHTITRKNMGNNVPNSSQEFMSQPQNCLALAQQETKPRSSHAPLLVRFTHLSTWPRCSQN